MDGSMTTGGERGEHVHIDILYRARAAHTFMHITHIQMYVRTHIYTHRHTQTHIGTHTHTHTHTHM